MRLQQTLLAAPAPDQSTAPAILPSLCSILLALAMSGCSALPTLTKPTVSHPVDPVPNPGFAVAEVGKAGSPQGLSHVARIESGPEAFATRVALTRFAKQSLDMQYYIWDGDKTGTYLMGELLDAADRGVRVRLLLDDHYSMGLVGGIVSQLRKGLRAFAADVEQTVAIVTPDALERRDRMRSMMKDISSGGRDLIAAALDTHPNIEVRMFNPVPTRSQGSFRRLVEMIAHFGHLNRRMHNKIFDADNQLAVVGGRNIADNYFGVSEDRNVRDLDLLVSGPVVKDVSSSFDSYWNSQWAVPVQAFAWKVRSKMRLGELRKELALVIDRKNDPSQKHLENDVAVQGVLRDVSARMVDAPVTVVADVPEKFSGSAQPLVSQALGALADNSKKEILLETAYFVPASPTYTHMNRRLADGVTIRTLTNSLASTDQVAAQAGYTKRRRDLLKSGVEMHELRTFGKNTSIFGFLTEGSRAGLHTKSVVFDRKKVFVGTFNLDPRSAQLNTEIGLLVDNPVLAQQVAQYIDRGMQPERSWRVQLGDPGKSSSRRMCWSAGDPAHPLIVHHEPEASLMSRIIMRVLTWLPIDRYL
jgi:putative cardiolipin synthase